MMSSPPRPLMLSSPRLPMITSSAPVPLMMTGPRSCDASSPGVERCPLQEPPNVWPGGAAAMAKPATYVRVARTTATRPPRRPNLMRPAMCASLFEVVVHGSQRPRPETTATAGELCTTGNLPLLRHTDNHFAKIRCSSARVNHRSQESRPVGSKPHDGQGTGSPLTRRDRHPEEALEALAFETRAIHVGQEPDPATGAVVVPIYQTSLFVSDEVDVDRGWTYSRTGNPTRAALERCIAS